MAGLLLFTDHTEQALTVLDAVRARHDGTKQSPWNDIECGDHYVRAMSSWLLLEAASGFHYDADKEALAFAPRVNTDAYRAPFVTRDGWGTFILGETGAKIKVAYGSLTLSSLTINETTTSYPDPRTIQARETLRVGT